MSAPRASLAVSLPRAFARRAAVWSALLAGALLAGGPAAAQPPAADETLRRIEHRVERNPTRAARELADWLAQSPAVSERERLRIDLVRAEIAGAMDSSAAALAQVDAVLPRVRATGDAGLLARALVVRVRLLDFLNRGGEALADSQVALEQAQAANAAELHVDLLVMRAGIFANRADFAAAYAALDDAQRRAREVGSRHSEGNVAYYAAWLASAVGDRRRAIEMFQLALAAYRSDDDPNNTADTLVGLSIAFIRDRRAAEALAPLDEGVRLYAELGDARGTAVAQAPRAVALAAVGRSGEAIAASDAALATLRPLDSGEEMLFALIYRAQAANLLQRPRVALAALDESRALANATENEMARLAFLRESSIAYAALGQPQEAHTALAEYVRRSEAHNDQRLSRQLAAQRALLESQRLERDNDLLRREADASRQAMAALERAGELRLGLMMLVSLIGVAMLYGLWWQRGVNRRFAVLAATDPLTGAFNRRRIGELGQEAFAAHRAGGKPFSVALLDLDHFKQFNDRYGHATGDAVLCAVAQALGLQLGGNDRLGRYGGEEFAVLLPGLDPIAAAAQVERLRTAVAALSLETLGVEGHLTLSAGVTAVRPNDASFEAVVNRADVALYRAKSAGRNRVTVDAVEPADSQQRAA